jgi:starch synthase
MNILFIATELAPYFSTGGLADVVYGLSRELGFQKGVNVRVILPYHRRMYQKAFIQTVLTKVPISLDSYSREANLFKIDEQPTVYLVDQDYYFNRDDYYGYIDDYERFIFFSRAVLEMVGSDKFAEKENGWFPDIIQGFDWIAGLFPMLLEKDSHSQGKFSKTKFSLFIHNLRRSGIFSSRALYLLGEKKICIYPEINETSEHISFLGRGVLQADRLITVNPIYNDLDNPLPETARYLENTFNGRLSGEKPTLVGIPSGIDEDTYDPETDPVIKYRFSPATISERANNKLELQKELKLKVDAKVPMIGIISRLIPENGIELLPVIHKHLEELGEIQLVILADPGDEMYKSMLEAWDRDQDMTPPWIKCRFDHNDILARQIYASCDICLIPSQEMPSGITHLIAMRYGALPLVHHTGCMVKNIVSYGPDIKLRNYINEGIGVGFKH